MGRIKGQKHSKVNPVMSAIKHQIKLMRARIKTHENIILKIKKQIIEAESLLEKLNVK